MTQGGKRYIDYLKDGNRVNSKFLMPKEAHAPAEIGKSHPDGPRTVYRTTEDYIRLAEVRERSYKKDIRNVIVKEIQQEKEDFNNDCWG